MADQRGRRLRNIVGGSAGNLVEWYDWYVYTAFALYFAPVFFPAGDRTTQLLNTAAIFAVGFVMRPIGAWVMGTYADRRGRKAGLTVSVSLMCAGSLMIALAPTYAQIGWLAPAILVLARMLQGLSVGGEYGASATYLSEMAGRKRRGFYSSFQYVTLISGQLIALAVLLALQFTMSEAALEAWGWRIPFAIGALLAVVVFYIRRRLAETESFTNAKASDRPKSSGRNLFRDHPREALLVMALTAGGTLAFYAYTTYMQKFLVNTDSAARRRAGDTAALFCYVPQRGRSPLGQDGRQGGEDHLRLRGLLLTADLHPLDPCANDRRFFSSRRLLIVPATHDQRVVKAELLPAHIRPWASRSLDAIANAMFGGTRICRPLVKNQGIEAPAMVRAV